MQVVIQRDTRARQLQVWLSFVLAKTLRDRPEADLAEARRAHSEEQ